MKKPERAGADELATRADIPFDIPSVGTPMPQSVKPTASNPIPTSFDIKEQAHFSHFDNVAGHIKDLGNVYLSKIAGTSGLHRRLRQRLCPRSGRGLISITEKGRPARATPFPMILGMHCV